MENNSLLMTNIKYYLSDINIIDGAPYIRFYLIVCEKDIEKPSKSVNRTHFKKGQKTTRGKWTHFACKQDSKTDRHYDA